ncbi:MAG: sodium:calcium antiporter [Candidatus Zixiibacteriota bacterium]|nr:MAG: sodium:calcium antiporter [candidate division Zixibacteria bacterium]
MTPHEKLAALPKRLYCYCFLAAVVTLPGLWLGVTHGHLSPVLGAIIYGVAVFGAAFMLSWAAEAAQMDISQSLAIAILALVAVLPEYAVDFVLTWKAAHHPQYMHYAIANMTGANRMLIGLGWPVVLFLYLIVRKKGRLQLHQSQRVEIFYLAMATIYSISIPLKGSLNLFDTLVLVLLFVLYTRRAAQMETTEPEPVGPVRIVAAFGKSARRIITAGLFLYSGLVIFFVAEPFAESLIESGKMLGINEFYLLQWLAPIASEAPEFIVAAIWTLRGEAAAAMRALISSKVNQWTLLIGTIPLVYAIAGARIQPFVLDTLQDHELLLTSAQSLFAVALLVDLHLSLVDGILLLALFSAQLFVPAIRLESAAAYVLLAIYYHIIHRRCLIPAAKVGLGFKRWQ